MYLSVYLRQDGITHKTLSSRGSIANNAVHIRPVRRRVEGGVLEKLGSVWLSLPWCSIAYLGI